MSDLLREINEDLRLERLRRLGRRYGPAAVAAAVMVAVLVGGWYLWQNRLQERRAANADHYASIITDLARDRAGGTGEADRPAPPSALPIADLVDLAHEAEPGYALLASLSAAAARAGAGDQAGALALYDAVAGDEGVPPHYRALADLQAALLLLDHGAAAIIRDRTARLTRDPEGPWYALAREINAHLAYRESDIETARSEFQALAADASAPSGVRSRARRMLQLWPDSES